MTSIGAEKMTQNTVGVDVSKDWLDAHRLSDAVAKRFQNSARGWRALRNWAAGALIAFEPSGPYHKGFERALADACAPFAKINPLQARRFAEAIGTRAKTDAVDARVLARMAAVLDLPPTPPASETALLLKELQVARQALLKDRTAAKNRAKRLTLAVLKRQNAARLRHVEAQLEGIDAEIDAVLSADPDLSARRDILISIPGVSAITAAAMLIEAPELGALEPAQAASLAGVAPFTRASGKWKGVAKIGGGRSFLRIALYMPALVAARFNPDMKAVYDRLRSAGKPPKVALTALMRKLIILANALLRDERKWTPRSA